MDQRYSLYREYKLLFPSAVAQHLGHYKANRHRTKKGCSQGLLLDQSNTSSTETFDELEQNENTTGCNSHFKLEKEKSIGPGYHAERFG